MDDVKYFYSLLLPRRTGKLVVMSSLVGEKREGYGKIPVRLVCFLIAAYYIVLLLSTLLFFLLWYYKREDEWLIRKSNVCTPCLPVLFAFCSQNNSNEKLNLVRQRRKKRKAIVDGVDDDDEGSAYNVLFLSLLLDCFLFCLTV